MSGAQGSNEQDKTNKSQVLIVKWFYKGSTFIKFSVLVKTENKKKTIHKPYSTQIW